MIESIKIKKAKDIAYKYLGDKPRKSGESFNDHTLEVYNTAIKAGITDETMLIATLLHHIDKEHDKEIEEEFGSETVTFINDLRKLADFEINVATPKNSNSKYAIQTFVNLTHDIRVIIVRLIDRAVNIQTAYFNDPQIRKESAERALYIYSPICRILGLSKLSGILEDSAFKILFPDQYFNVAKVVYKKKNEINRFFDDAVPFLKTILKEQEINAEIKTRIKHYFSIYKKTLSYMNIGKLQGKFYDKIPDIAGMRILVDTEEQCYFVEDILKKVWEFVPEERDDYIKNPKPGGYKSLHNIFKINSKMNLEIQIRTHQMHEENEYGGASHFFYKIGEKFKNNILTNPNWLKEINYWENQNQITASPQINHFRDNVYAFTPKGDIIELPRGANIIDFAYYIHSKVGNNCVGGVVNGNIVKIDYEIKDGDKVEILTSSKKKKPSADWIKIAKTKKAAGMIRKALLSQ